MRIPKVNSMKKILFLLPLFLFTLSSIYASELLEGKPISSIQIAFQNGLSTQQQSSALLTEKLQSKKGLPFSQATFDQDLKVLSEEFDWVEPAISYEDNELIIDLKVWPKPLIHAIHWEGNVEFSKSRLQKELDITPKTLFDREKFNQNFLKVKQFYLKRGYFQSQISYEVKPLENTNEVDIVVRIKEGRTGRIYDIDYQGLTKAEVKEVNSKIYTRKYNKFTSWLTGFGKLQKEVLDQDEMAILSFLNEEGYADAKVDIAALEHPETNGLLVQLQVDKGPLYHFGEIHIEGNSLFTQEEIEKKLCFKKGETFSPDKVRDSVQAIKSLYGQKGYIDTQVQYETYISSDSPVFNLDFSIQESEQFQVGLIHIVGNHQTNANVILRESLLTPGELFDSRKLEATQKRLENIGYFKNVTVFPVKNCPPPTDTATKRDVYIEVDEASTGSVSVFMGLSSQDSLNGGLDLTERNFNIRGFTTLFTKGLSSLRGGGEYFHARASIGKKQNNYFITWMDPYFRDSLWRVGFELSKANSRLQSKEYDTDTYGVTLFSSYPITNLWTYGLKYRFRYTDADVDSDAGEPLRRFDNSGILSAMGTSMSYDSTDSSYKPHRGLRSSLEGEFSGLGGKFIFSKINFNNTLYLPITQRTTLKFRGNLGFLEPFYGSSLHRIPLSERYFLGGNDSVRGYKPFILGPHENNEPIGGLSSSLLSTEYNIELLPILDVFAFVDGGSISNKQYHPSALRWSTGVGARIEIMQRTPIIVGYGIPLNPQKRGDGKSDKEEFFFSMGGQF